MFKRLPEVAAIPVTMSVNGTEVVCREGDSVASALFLAGFDACRETPVKGTARGPFCMMGVCFDCLTTIDGSPNQQACMVLVKPGMKVEYQMGAREVQS